jgi:peptide/nickel transport system substrate-binding protein
LVALTLAIASAGCGSGKGQNVSKSEIGSSKPYAELHWGVTNFAGPIDLLQTIEPSMASAEELAVLNLMEYEQSGKVKLGVASSVEQPNSTTYVYQLKPEKFSNGKPLTAADVVFSLKRNLGPVWTKGYWEDVASITARGDSTVVIKLKRPSAIWEYVLAATGQVLEEAQVERVGKALGTPGNLPIGTGPWKLDSYQPESSIQLSRNPYWTGSPARAAKVTVSLFKTEASMGLALRSGAIDGMFAYSPKIFAGIPGIRQLRAPGDFVTYAAMNTSRPPFNDIHVRRAVAYAADVNGMISSDYPASSAIASASIVPVSLFAGLGSTSQVSAMLGALPKYHFDLAAAKRELAKSAYPHGFTMKIQVPALYSIDVSDAEILISDLAKIGVKAKLQEIQPDEESRLGSESSKLVTMEVSQTGSVYEDPEGIFASLLPASQIGPPGSGLNIAAYRNAEVEKLEAEELEILNSSKRLQLIGKMLEAVGAELPYVPLYVADGLGAVSDKYVYPTFGVLESILTPWALDVKLAS